MAKRKMGSGEAEEEPSEPLERITISLPQSQFIQLEEICLQRRLKKEKGKATSYSAIMRDGFAMLYKKEKKP